MKYRFIVCAFCSCLMLITVLLNQGCTAKPKTPKNVTLHYAVKCDVLQEFKNRNDVFYAKKFISNYTQTDSVAWNVWNAEKKSDTLLFNDEHHLYNEFGTCLVIDSLIPQVLPANQPDSFNYSVYARGFSQILILENKTQRSLLKMEATYRFDIWGNATSKTDVSKINQLLVLFLNKHFTSTVSKDLTYYMNKHTVSDRWVLTEPDFEQFSLCEN